MAVENSNPGNIFWYPIENSRRQPRGGLWMTYSGSGKVTFSQTLGDELEERRIRFGEKNGYLCFAFTTMNEGVIVRHRQVTDAVLRRHSNGLVPGTKIHFEFDPDQAIFIESRRDRIAPSGGASGTIGATRTPAELQP